MAIHPRLRTEFFLGRPDYALAAEVKEALTIPVFISGGIINFKLAEMVYSQTGVDGFLIGRGMWAKPWKLYEMNQKAMGNSYSITSSEILACALKHLDLMIGHYGIKGLYIFRKHLPFYIKGLPSAGSVRKKLVVSESVDEIKEGLINFLGSGGI